MCQPTSATSDRISAKGEGPNAFFTLKQLLLDVMTLSCSCSSLPDCVAAIKSALNIMKPFVSTFGTPAATIVNYSYDYEVQHGSLLVVEHAKEESVSDLWARVGGSGDYSKRWNHYKTAIAPTLIDAHAGDSSLIQHENELEAVLSAVSTIEACLEAVERWESVDFAKTAATAACTLASLLDDMVAAAAIQVRQQSACEQLAAACAAQRVFMKPVAEALKQLRLDPSVHFLADAKPTSDTVNT